MTGSAPRAHRGPPPTTSGGTAWTRLAEGWLLTLTGEHDLATAPELEHQMQQVCDSSTNASVLIDLTETTFIDCQVIGWLVRWCEHGRRSPNFRLCVATGDASVAKRLIDLLGLDELAPCRASKGEAVAMLMTPKVEVATPARSRPNRPVRHASRTATALSVGSPST
jgi:anti-anti-sigma factor